MDIRKHNRIAWDKEVEKGNPWTIPVGREGIVAAKKGDWTILLTPTKPVPRDWLPNLVGARVLCLASGGGQQGPVLAAVGAHVTVLDNSPKQLQQDRFVAEREELTIALVEGDMADLSIFSDRSFDIIVNPVSNVFIPDVRPVWREAFRVLRSDGILIAGFDNPVIHLFDYTSVERTGKLEVKNALPYSDINHLTEEEQQLYKEEERPFEFGHTLEDQIGGQLAAGFMITGFYEDYDREDEDSPLRNYMPTYIATRAVKP
ncbi:MAG: methyltransferase domain-containing protein [Aliifodinibius sp.]|nr:class I SAM-dependent methyltransferase [Fodinibius sp.]NIV15051.1 methyltransferase domain-containing protein [Fodinibius sp.]NIY28904.1 methyltransferase domain-containing protein [Fodinibius sp.]